MGGTALPLPPPPLHCSSVSVCPLHGKGRRAPPILVSAGPQPLTPPKVRTPAFHNTHVTVLHCPTAGSSPHIHLLPSTLAPSHLNWEGQPPTEIHMKPPRSCRPHAWLLTTQRERDRPGAPLSAMLVPPVPQGLTGLIQHSAGSKTMLPAPAWPQGSQQPLWLHPAPKMGHSCKHCLHAGASTG